jgi:hypothetical protein
MGLGLTKIVTNTDSVKMTKPRRIPSRSRRGKDASYAHRQRILLALLGICRKMERMEVSAEARRACRDVAGSLRLVLATRKPVPGGRKG